MSFGLVYNSIISVIRNNGQSETQFSGIKCKNPFPKSISKTEVENTLLIIYGIKQCLIN